MQAIASFEGALRCWGANAIVHVTARVAIGLALLLTIGETTRVAATPPNAASPQPGQIPIVRIDSMPNLPHPYAMRDWKKVARDLDALLFDPTAHGEFLPLCWTDTARRNFAADIVGIPSYIGHPEMTSGTEQHESITFLGAVLGAQLVGVDKTRQRGLDFVRTAHCYFNSANGQDLYLNRVDTRTGQTYWYELYPGILAWQLHAAVPSAAGFDQRLRRASDQLAAAADVLAGGDMATSTPEFGQTAFDFVTSKPVDNKQWREPDGAAGFAWMLNLAYLKWKDPRHLAAANACLRYLDRLPYEQNPYYEVLLPFGVAAAARMNAEQGTRHDVHKLMCWLFGFSHARPGFGIIADGPEGRWGDYDCHGLVGSITDGGGYVFEMNGYSAAAAIAPVARYDDRYARAIGKWILNLANASRLFYGNALPPANQTCFDWLKRFDPNWCVAYEGLRASWKGVAPKAMGDPLVTGWAKTDLGIYGSGHVGLLGAIVDTTEVEGVLRIDLLATDWFHAPAYPTYLLYNPHAKSVTVSVSVASGKRDLYEATGNRFLVREAAGQTSITVPADSAFVVVSAPAGGKLTRDANRTVIDGVVVDYCNETSPLPAPARRYDVQEAAPQPDRSIVVKAPKVAQMRIDGEPTKWARIGGPPLRLSTHGRGSLEMELRFAWDRDNLYVMARQTAKGTTTSEAANGAEYAKRSWDFDGVSLFFDYRNRNKREDVKDLNVWLGLNSSGQKDLVAVRSHREASPERVPMPGLKVASSGSAAAGDRVVEAAIPWADVAAQVSSHRLPVSGLTPAVRSGFRFGCEPLLLDSGWHAQSFANGSANRIPAGNDEGSVDIVLEDKNSK